MVYNYVYKKEKTKMDIVNFPYYTLNAHLRERFGCKVVKLSIDAGFTCPNRDGKISHGGCIFCSRGGSGDFAGNRLLPISRQLEAQKSLLKNKWPSAKYIAYFQAFTNTYATVPELRKKYYEALSVDDVIGLSVATRPDCLDDEIIELLREISRTKLLWVELGLQTSNEASAKFINRGYKNNVFEYAVNKLNSAGIETVVHIILGLPYETEKDMLESVRYACSFNINGIKLQLLHVLKDTPLYEIYTKTQFKTMSLEEYADIICKCLEIIPKNIVIHRLTGDGPKKDLIAPLLSADKKSALNKLNKIMRKKNVFQGNKLIEITGLK